jgi:alpha-tubulin suppressor-like RCC1 family protein
MISGDVCHTSAIKTNGTLWSWGGNSYYGQLGTNNTTSYSTPTQEHCGGTTWCAVSAGGYRTSAIKTDGTLWSWGNNTCGALGTNDTTTYSTPTQEHCGGTNWCMVSVSVGSHHSAIKTDGTLWSWGCNFLGQLGTNNITSYSTPTQEHCGGTNWCMVSSGGSHTSAIKTDGTLWSWGVNNNGRLGTNNTTSYSTPTQEHCGGTNWCMVSSDLVHTSAIKTDGTLWGWGGNGFGRLGTNNQTNQSSPTQEACGGTTWCMVSASGSQTSGIKTDGTLWSWGNNGFGKLGTNNDINYSTPTQEACGGTTWCMVSGGYYHTLAIRID